MLTGPQPTSAVSAEFYQRLASDLRANGKRVVADLTDGALKGALEGGLDLLKLSDDELVAEGLAPSRAAEDVVAGMQRLHRRGADDVLVSRAAEPALALLDGRLHEVCGPRLEPRDPTGTGDSMFAATGAGGGRPEHGRRLAARGRGRGSHVTRRGLGSGSRVEIERMMRHVRLR